MGAWSGDRRFSKKDRGGKPPSDNIRGAKWNGALLFKTMLEGLFVCTHNKQLLDEVEHDSENYQGRGLCYLPKPKAEADNTNRGLDNFAIMRKPNPIIVLLYNYKCTSVETLSAKTRHTYMHKRQCL